MTRLVGKVTLKFKNASEEHTQRILIVNPCIQFLNKAIFRKRSQPHHPLQEIQESTWFEFDCNLVIHFMRGDDLPSKMMMSMHCNDNGWSGPNLTRKLIEQEMRRRWEGESNDYKDECQGMTWYESSHQRMLCLNRETHLLRAYKECTTRRWGWCHTRLEDQDCTSVSSRQPVIKNRSDLSFSFVLSYLLLLHFNGLLTMRNEGTRKRNTLGMT